MQEAYGRLPLGFEANQGQAAGPVKFLARGQGYGLFLTGNEAMFTLRSGKAAGSQRPESLSLRLAGANATPQISGLDELPGRSNYFFGNDPAHWHTGVVNYAKVEYRNVYPGVNLIYYGNQRQLEYDFVVAPGADPRAIRLGFDGARGMRVDAGGNLLLRLAHGEVIQHKPVIYQETAGGRQIIPGRYVISRKNGRREVSFAIGGYDRGRALVIDPVLAYSTYLGGGGGDEGRGIAVDGSGNVYVAGFTNSTNFPGGVRVPTGSTGGKFDAFVVKLNPAGNALVYSAYIGGGEDDAARDIAIDASGNAWIVGQTTSNNFPTVNPQQGTFSVGNCGTTDNPRACEDAFVAKLNAAGSALSFSTYLGGSGSDIAFGVAVDADNNAVVVGQTGSMNFPLQSALRPMSSGGIDAFVTKYNSTGSQVIYSTYLGGQKDDVALSVAVDSGRNAYVTGYTQSTDFPTMSPLQSAPGGANDVFVSKLNSAGSALSYSTYLGGGLDDIGYGIAVDGAGNAYVSGVTSSANFPVLNPVQSAYGGGGRDAFVTKINTGGSALVYSTWLGGSSDDYGSRIAVDAAGNAHVTGNTYSTNFPVTNIVPNAAGSDSDVFVVKLNAAGSQRLFSTYLGGNGNDFGNAIALDAAGNVFVTGFTGSTSFPTASPLYGATAGGGDAFITKINSGQNTGYLTTVLAANYKGDAIAPEAIVAGFGVNLADNIYVATTLPLPTQLGGVTVKVRDSNGNERSSPLFFVAPTQINYQIPPGTALGRATVTVLNSSNTIVSAGIINVAPISPALFTADASGGGAPAAFAIRVKANGEQVYEQVANGATPIQMDLGPQGEQVFLILYGTGIRGRSSQSAVTVNYLSNGTSVATTGVDYADQQGSFAGLDQLNLVLPRTLIGRGLLDLVVIVDGQPTNAVRLNIK
ncbi:MAG TPA: SBBP repeat-containing protein [Blastocatellia bacterium]|nr:SBBP repeat-containing protein [Blastocatellia bacterium]